MPSKNSILRKPRVVGVLRSGLCGLFLLFSATGCGIYSFTGTSLSPDIKSITISNFSNNSGGGPPTLSQSFSEKVRDYYQRNTNLDLVTRNADLTLEGTIVSYTVTPLPPSANDVASQSRLTIGIKATYQNLKDETQNFDESFSFYADFPSNQNLATVEASLIETISDQIIILMFNKSVANW